MDDQSLVADIRRGVPGAAAALIQQHNRALWRIVRGILRDDSEAEDALQDAYLRAFSRIGEFRGDAAIGTWLARIAINEAFRRLSARRVGQQTKDARPDLEGPSLDDLVATEPSPEQLAARAEMRHMVERAVDALPAPFRLVVIMRVIEQMSIEETAAALSIPPATVKTRLHRANVQLRSVLGGELAAAFQGAFPFGGARCMHLTRTVLDRIGLFGARAGERLSPIMVSSPMSTADDCIRYQEAEADVPGRR